MAIHADRARCRGAPAPVAPADRRRCRVGKGPAGHGQQPCRADGARYRTTARDGRVGVGTCPGAGAAGWQSNTGATAFPDHTGGNMSRLIAPRQLEKFRDWIACVVPAFRAGAEAGLTVPRPRQPCPTPGAPARVRSPCPCTTTGLFPPAPTAISKHWPSVSPRPRRRLGRCAPRRHVHARQWNSAAGGTRKWTRTAGARRVDPTWTARQ